MLRENAGTRPRQVGTPKSLVTQNTGAVHRKMWPMIRRYKNVDTSRPMVRGYKNVDKLRSMVSRFKNVDKSRSMDRIYKNEDKSRAMVRRCKCRYITTVADQAVKRSAFTRDWKKYR